MSPNEFERRAVSRLAYNMMTWWEKLQTESLREPSLSTASIPRLAFESIRLEGHHPTTVLAIFLRDIVRCQYLFGWRCRFWGSLEDWIADGSEQGRRLRADPEAYGSFVWLEFLESIDIHEPELPPSEQCRHDGVTWLRTRMSPSSDVGPDEGNQAPWRGPTAGSSLEPSQVTPA